MLGTVAFLEGVKARGVASAASAVVLFYGGELRGCR
jgi:hypothetical protein